VEENELISKTDLDCFRLEIYTSHVHVPGEYREQVEALKKEKDAVQSEVDSGRIGSDGLEVTRGYRKRFCEALVLCVSAG